jgi:hypothetical protein
VGEDRASGERLAKHPELKSRTPVILGGHDHEIYIDTAGNSVVCKVQGS